MSEQIPAIEPDFIELKSSPNRRQFLRAAFAIGGMALIFVNIAEVSVAQALQEQSKPAAISQTLNNNSASAPDHMFQTAPTTITPEEDVTVTCDLGCDGDGLTDANYTVDEEISDIVAAGIEGINQRININNIADIPGLSANFSTKNCSPTSPLFKLGPLNQLDNKVQAAGLKFSIDMDGPNLSTTQPRVVKCVAYVLAKDFDGQTPGGPAPVTNFMFGKEENDKSNYAGNVANYALRLEAASQGLLAGNKLAQPEIGAMRTDGVGIDPAVYDKELAAADPNPIARKFGYHIYSTKAERALARQNTKQSIGQATMLFVAAVAKARQDINNAWPNLAYTPGAQYTDDDEPVMMDIDEEGYQANLMDPNGVSVATQATMDGQEILSMIKNPYGVVRQAEFEFLDGSRNTATGKPGFQTGFVYESGPDLNQWPVNRDTPMTTMMPGIMAQVKQAQNG